MSTDWLGPRIYRPSLEEVLRGAISPSAPHVHYITHFRYPKHGGFVSYLKKFVPLGNLKLNHELVSIDPRTRQLRFSNGFVAHYDALISSVPLPDLIRMIEGRATGCFRCLSSSGLLNLRPREHRREPRGPFQRSYDLLLRRRHLLYAPQLSPHAFSPTTFLRAPEAFRRKSTSLKSTNLLPAHPMTGLNRSSAIFVAVASSARMIASCCSNAMLLRYANIIFDLDRAAALKTVHGYLDDLGIAYCGRYGDWGYMWTDESFKSGELAAEKSLSTQGSKAAFAK